MLLILIRVDSQPWDKDLRLKARHLRYYMPEDFGLEPYLVLNPSADLIRFHLEGAIKNLGEPGPTIMSLQKMVSVVIEDIDGEENLSH
jgi:hypothetical protein